MSWFVQNINSYFKRIKKFLSTINIKYAKGRLE